MAVKKRYLSVFYLGIIMLAGLVLFWPTFSLAIFGDNWMVFWGGKTTLGTVQPWNNWATYFSPYGTSYLILYLINRFFGYSGTALYVFSFLARFLAVLGLFIFLKNRGFPLAAVFLGSLLFMVTPIGLETTDWAFQMTSYLSIFFLLLVADLAFGLSSWKKVSLFLLYFFFAVATNPIRAHGTIPLVLLLLLAEVLLNKRYRIYLVGATISLVILFVVMSRKYTFGDPQNTLGALTPGLVQITQSLQSKDPTLVFNYLASVASTLVPDYLIDQVRGWDLGNRSLLLVPITVLSALNLWKLYLWRDRRLTKLLSSIFAVNLIFLLGIYKLLRFLPHGNIRVQVLVAIAFIAGLLAFTILDYWGKYRDKARIDIFCLGLATLFLVLPWVHGPSSVLPSYHRYLIYGALVAPILFASFIASLSENHQRDKILKFLGLLITSLISIYFFALTSYYLAQAQYRHGQEYAEAVWKNLDRYLKDVNFDNRRTLFYFVGDEPERAHSSISFGFGFHAGIRYGIWKQSDLPTVINDPGDLKSMLTDGKASRKYIAQEYIYPKDNVFVLKIEGVNVTRLGLNDILPARKIILPQ